jgi:hypothetical protein
VVTWGSSLPERDVEASLHGVEGPERSTRGVVGSSGTQAAQTEVTSASLPGGIPRVNRFGGRSVSAR